MYDIGQILDLLLDYLVRDEYRECCYLADDLQEYMHQRAWETGNIKRAFMHCTGSDKEGVLNYNDIDLMMVEPDFLVFDSVGQIPAETLGHGILLLETDDCYPGYTRLLVHTEPSDEVGDVYTRVGNKQYLNAKKWMIACANLSLSIRDFVTHGPAILAAENFDLVMCLKCMVWPKCAKCFGDRSRLSRNPSRHDIEYMMSLGCHVVAVAHPQSLNPDLEYRMSFSFVEKHLIRRWSTKQLKCYFLLKELVKNYFGSSEDNFEKGLCSYYMKTLMFWAIEEYDEQFWEQNLTFFCIKRLLDKLKDFVVEQKCPNYFIPENLMVSSYTSDQIESISNRIDQVQTDLYAFILRTHNFAQLSEQFDLVLSLWETLNPLGNEEMLEEIMNFVTYVSLKNDIENRVSKEHALIKTLCVQFRRFFTFCLSNYWNKDCDTVAILHDVEQYLFKLTKINSSVLISDFYVCLQRSIALYTLERAYKTSDHITQLEMLGEVENIFMRTTQIPGYTKDQNLTGFAYLGLLYYVVGSKQKSKQFLQGALLAGSSNPSSYMLTLPVILPCGGPDGLRFLRNDQILTELLEKVKKPCEFDPFLFASYLLYQLSGDEAILKNIGRLDKHLRRMNVGGIIRMSYDFILEKLGVNDIVPENKTNEMSDSDLEQFRTKAKEVLAQFRFSTK